MRSIQYFLRCAASLGGLVHATLTTAEPLPSADPWKLVWQDEFETNGPPDPNHWDYDVGGSGWGNRELQYYTKQRLENARVEDGRLIIEARQEDEGGRCYSSARLVTKPPAAWTYGRFEVRAKLPVGRGSWPAIWMLPVERRYGSRHWPDIGEIDIMEHVGHDEGAVHATVHSKDYNWKIDTQKTAITNVPDATEAFHVYAVEWTAEEILAYVDDQLYFTCQNDGSGWASWPFDQPFHLILNIAVGGDWGGMEGVDDAAFPLRLEIEYVRVYQAADAES